MGYGIGGYGGGGFTGKLDFPTGPEWCHASRRKMSACGFSGAATKRARATAKGPHGLCTRLMTADASALGSLRRVLCSPGRRCNCGVASPSEHASETSG